MNPLYIYAIVALLVAGAGAGTLGFMKGKTYGTTIAETAMQTHLALDRKAEADAQEAARKVEGQLAVAQNAVAQSYEKGKKDAEASATTTVADLRTGNLKLRRHWAGCETDRLSEATTATRQLDAATRDREESAGRIVRAAAQCDAQVRGLQEIVKSLSQAQ